MGFPFILVVDENLSIPGKLVGCVISEICSSLFFRLFPRVGEEGPGCRYYLISLACLIRFLSEIGLRNVQLLLVHATPQFPRRAPGWIDSLLCH